MEIGDIKGELRILKYLGGSLWACLCSCGNFCSANTQKLQYSYKRDYPASCGCLKRRSNPLFPTYSGILQRCNNPKADNYKNYGGRGIKVCYRWSKPIYGFRNFDQDMGQKPEGMALDRIDNNGDYSKENCRWADLSTQRKNQRKLKNKSSIYKGVSWSKNKKKWKVSIFLSESKKNLFCGCFNSEIEAALTYDAKARELGYEEVWLNFPKLDTE